MKKIHIQLTLLLLVIVALIWVFGCKKDDFSSRTNLGSKGFQARLTNESTIDGILDDIAKIVAVAQANEEFREILLDEAQLNIGLENLILYFRIKDKVLPNANITVKGMFTDISSSLSLSYDSAWFNCGIVQDLPQLNFNLVVTDDEIEIEELETWGLSLVLGVTSDFEGEDDYLQTGYDYNLVDYQISNNVEPEEQYIMAGYPCPWYIVVENHTGLLVAESDWDIDLYDSYGYSTVWDYMGVVPTQAMKDALDSAKLANDLNVYIPLNICGYSNIGLVSTIGLTELINALSIVGDEDPDPKGDDCPRDAFDDLEEITKIQINPVGLKKFCKWPRKWCSLSFVSTVITYPPTSSLGPLSKPKSFRRKEMKKNKTYTLTEGITFFRWWYLEGLYGNPYRFDVIGNHPKVSIEDEIEVGFNMDVIFKLLGVTTPIPVTLSWTHKIKHKDEPLGSDFIYYCDGVSGDGSEYDLGSIKIWVREKN